SVLFVPSPSLTYQSNLTPNCTCRGSYVPVIVPKVALLRLAAGARKFTRSNRLNASTRNWSFVRPPSATFLLAARSNCVKFGPRTLLRGALPNGWLGSVGSDTHAALNQLVIDCEPAGAYGSQVTVVRQLLAPVKELLIPETL